jgi:cobalamin-dependent methionine synthase I
MDTKKCSKCGVEKALCEFNKNKNAKDGLCPSCKECRRAAAKVYRSKNKEKIRQKNKNYYSNNRQRLIEVTKKWCEENKERWSSYSKLYREQNREKRQEWERKKRQEDPSWRARKNVSRAVYAALKKQGSTKGGETFSSLPYTPSDLAEHLEKQFDETMTWENYGTYWDVDHIYPQSLLPYDSLDHPNFQKCWALDNLQPLEKSENRAKSNKVLDA